MYVLRYFGVCGGLKRYDVVVCDSTFPSLSSDGVNLVNEDDAGGVYIYDMV